MFGLKIKIKEFEYDKDLEKYVDFKAEFLKEFWSDEYKNYMIKNFKLLNNQYLLLVLKKNIIIVQLYISFEKKYCIY
jgi:hypothetical protein